jgi:hypothetical protein
MTSGLSSGEDPSNGSDGSPFGDVVHRYMRAEAIADGVFVDVTRQASPAEMHGGFRVPVAVTAALWAAIEAIPPSLAGTADVRGRLHDVLWMANLALRRVCARAKEATEADKEQATTGADCPLHRNFAFLAGAHVATFAVHLPFADTRKRVHTLRADGGPDDEGRLCVTVGFPEDF